MKTANDMTNTTSEGNAVAQSLFKRTTYAQRVMISIMLATGVASGATSALTADQALAAELTPSSAQATQTAGSTAEQAEEAVAGLSEFADYGLVGFEQTNLSCHTNSNIATDTLKANGQTFGTNNVAEAEQSLIAHTDSGMTQVTTANGSTVLVGPENTVAKADCPQAMMVNGAKVTCNGGDAGTLRQATEDEFPDFEGWRDDAGEVSRNIAALQDNVAYDDRDMNRRTVNANASGVSVVSVDAATLSKYNTEVHLHGVNDGVVVVNVDALGLKSLSLPSIIVNDEGNRERATWTAYNAVLNIVDSTADDQMYRGSVSFMGRVIGIVLAPYADVTAYHNVDGQIIASNITICGEFHRDSYTGPVASEDEQQSSEPAYPTITQMKIKRLIPPTSEMPEAPEAPEAPEPAETPETPVDFTTLESRNGANEDEVEPPAAEKIIDLDANEAQDDEEPQLEPSASEEPEGDVVAATEDGQTEASDITSVDENETGDVATIEEGVVPTKPAPVVTTDEQKPVKVIDTETKAAPTKTVAADRADASAFAEHADSGEMPKTGDAPMAAAAGFASIMSALAAFAARLRLRRNEER